MSAIIAARFQTQPEADRAQEALRTAGFGSDEVSSFYLNPAGQHASYPIGGDAHHDEGAKQSGKTAMAGGAIGGAAGAALGIAAAAAAEPGLAVPAAVAGAGVGAYVGSLAGAMAGTRAGDPRQASTSEPVERAAGVMVAVCVDRQGTEQAALDVLRAQGAVEMERATGEWRNGAWSDFDPRRTPQLIDVPAGSAPRGPGE